MSQPSEPRPVTDQELAAYTQPLGAICYHRLPGGGIGIYVASEPSTHGGTDAPESTEKSPKKEGKK